MSDAYLCIHGHFYQPPRENPWLEAIEYQHSARPYHDWNHRITRECYGPNARARLHGQGGRIVGLVNNYEYMSFNFGPTLLSWLENFHPWVYKQILEADRTSQIRYEGHGNALAQVYNHIIMPLASRKDKQTQIRWGLADFKQRFGREAEGMWLAETAVDTETLELLAAEGIKFTILSPTQAKAVRSLAGKSNKRAWQDVSEDRIDPTRPYRVRLDKSGHRFIDIFFYDGPLSRAVAYEKILSSGEDFLSRIEQAFGQREDGPRMVSVATDGESYGHHFKFGDLALSWLFDHIKQTNGIKLTNYALFLEDFPPENEVKLFENSSWSCAHGVERWRSDCGCSVGQTPGWNQGWRTPLRDGLDWLAREMGTLFEKRCGRLLKDPWKARDDYIHVLINPSDQQRKHFLKQHAAGRLEKEKQVEVWRLLESQRMSLYMFTSCGWFFDDISGLETSQVLKYAARAMDLVQGWANKDLEAGLMEFLEKADSNNPDYGNGRQVYERLVKPSRIDPFRATAHYALAALDAEVEQETCLFSGIIRSLSRHRFEDQKFHAMVGEVEFVEKMTGRSFRQAYAAYRMDGKELRCLVGNRNSDFALEDLAVKARSPLINKTLEEINGILSKYMSNAAIYSLKDLMVDTRQCIFEGLACRVYQQIKQSIEGQKKELDELLFLLEDTGGIAPPPLISLLRLLAVDELVEVLGKKRGNRPVDWSHLILLGAQAKHCDLKLTEPIIRKKSQDFLRLQMEHLTSYQDTVSIKNVMSFLDLAQDLNLELDLWQCQNVFYDLHGDPKFSQNFSSDTAHAFHELGQRLGFLLEGE